MSVAAPHAWASDMARWTSGNSLALISVHFACVWRETVTPVGSSSLVSHLPYVAPVSTNTCTNSQNAGDSNAWKARMSLAHTFMHFSRTALFAFAVTVVLKYALVVCCFAVCGASSDWPPRAPALRSSLCVKYHGIVNMFAFQLVMARWSFMKHWSFSSNWFNQGQSFLGLQLLY